MENSPGAQRNAMQLEYWKKKRKRRHETQHITYMLFSWFSWSQRWQVNAIPTNEGLEDAFMPLLVWVLAFLCGSINWISGASRFSCPMEVWETNDSKRKPVVSTSPDFHEFYLVILLGYWFLHATDKSNWRALVPSTGLNKLTHHLYVFFPRNLHGLFPAQWKKNSKSPWLSAMPVARCPEPVLTVEDFSQIFMGTGLGWPCVLDLNIWSDGELETESSVDEVNRNYQKLSETIKVWILSLGSDSIYSVDPSGHETFAWDHGFSA